MVVDGHSEDGLRTVLTHSVLVKVALDGARPEVVQEGCPGLLIADRVVGEDLAAEFDAVIANGCAGDAGGELPEV
jgi:hypothetical protein